MPLDGSIIQALRPKIVIPQGLVGYWPLDLGSLNWGSNTAYDRSGNNHHGTFSGGINSASLAQGQVKQALNLSGSSQYIGCGNGPSLTRLSVVAWVYPAATSNFSIIVNKGTSVNRNYDFDIEGTTLKLRFFFTSGGFVGFVANTSLTPDRWSLAACTYDGATQRIFLNARPDGTNVTAATPELNTGLRIGSIDGDGTNFFTGRIQQVRIYNRAISAQEILSIYEAGRCGRA